LNITQEQKQRIDRCQEPIQQIVPHLSADEREFLITGLMPSSWDDIFPPERSKETSPEQK